MGRDCELRDYPSGDKLGEVIAIPELGSNFEFPKRRASRRCPPISILWVMRSELVGRIEAARDFEQRGATGMVQFEGFCVHLVAMKTNQGLPACFYCFQVPEQRLYIGALSFLDNRFLGIVLNLDGKFIEYNDLDSIDRKLESLKDSSEENQITSYLHDRWLLETYIHKDYVVLDDGGRVSMKNTQEPVIRVPNSQTVLTRVDAKDSSSSIIARVHPGWEAFRTYLVQSKFSRRFHVYACIDASQELVTKLWCDVLDPYGVLVQPDQAQYNLFGFAPGSTKSLDAIFSDGRCPTGMTLILDGKNNAWRDEDKSRVLEIEEFKPYQYSKEAASTVLSMYSTQVSVKLVRQAFIEFFDELVLQSFDILYGEKLSFPRLDVDLNFKPKKPDKEVAKSVPNSDKGIVVLTS